MKDKKNYKYPKSLFYTGIGLMLASGPAWDLLSANTGQAMIGTSLVFLLASMFIAMVINMD